LERFVPRRTGPLVNISSIAGRAGVAGGATYSASKFAVYGLSEALRAELHGSGIEVSVVMPIGVNTELYSGLPQMRGFKTPEPEDVAEAIISALQRPRFDVYVPRSMGALIRAGALMPRKGLEAFTRLMGADALTGPDHNIRAAYEARMNLTINGLGPAPGGAAAADEAAADETAADVAPAEREAV
jgi:short-subunit dehydrogenase